MAQGSILLCIIIAFSFAYGAPPHTIQIDGNFTDWDDIPSYYDPVDAENGTTMQEGVPDVHDTDSTGLFSKPVHVYNPNADLIEYKFTHDAENFYAYFKASGEIGITTQQNETEGSRAGRYYCIVTIDLDMSDETGYWLNEGGYYPTSGGYDVNFEVEFYNGSYNSGHYLNHGCHNEPELIQAFDEQTQGQIHLWAGYYDYYSQWVFWDLSEPPTSDEIDRCPDDMITLPDDEGYLCFVKDKAPGPFNGTVKVAKNGQELEMKAPYKGLLKDGSTPFVKEGMKIDVSFSLETSGEYSSPPIWCSDTGLPIKGYFMEGASPTVTATSSASVSNGSESTTFEWNWKTGSALIIMVVEALIILTLIFVVIFIISKKRSNERVSNSERIDWE